MLVFVVISDLIMSDEVSFLPPDLLEFLVLESKFLLDLLFS